MHIAYPYEEMIDFVTSNWGVLVQVQGLVPVQRTVLLRLLKKMMICKSTSFMIHDNILNICCLYYINNASTLWYGFYIYIYIIEPILLH